jgi:hypothetical protein
MGSKFDKVNKLKVEIGQLLNIFGSLPDGFPTFHTSTLALHVSAL